MTGTSACESSYTYDLNSRMITRGGGDIDWYTYDLPSYIETISGSGAGFSQFWYGSDRSRYKQRRYDGSSDTTIGYVGQLFEYEDDGSDGSIQRTRNYVHAGSRAVAMVEREIATGTNTTQYLHRDHQGSVTKVTSSGGSVTQSLAYDAWGLRRNASDWSSLGSPFAGSHETERGYTGHEHLDNVGLIHMNGRVQDPKLGRFISADPFIQAPFNTQSHNRYSYVWNNPATFVDPSGFQLMIPAPTDPYPGHDAFMTMVNSAIRAVPFDVSVIWEDYGSDGVIIDSGSETFRGIAHYAVNQSREQSETSLEMSGRYPGISAAFFPNVAQWGNRGVPGTFGSNAWGFIKAANNLGNAFTVGPNIQLPIFDNELSGAAAFDASTALVGPLVRGTMALSRVGAAARASPSLPGALTLGRNADTGVDVYLGVRNGQAVYCGISCNLGQRAAQHGSRFDALDGLTTNSITHGEARAIEQALIVRHPGFENIRNSISPAHSWYQQAVDWGEAWLKANGF